MPKEMFSKRASCGGSVMVWGAIGRNGKLDLQLVQSWMNAVRYREMLDRADLVDEGKRVYEERWTFMQDNAPIHVTNSSKKFFEDHNIALLDWPAYSPDLNPIENC